MFWLWDAIITCHGYLTQVLLIQRSRWCGLRSVLWWCWIHLYHQRPREDAYCGGDAKPRARHCLERYYLLPYSMYHKHQVEPFVPPHDMDLNRLSLEEEEALQTCMHRFAERVRAEMNAKQLLWYLQSKQPVPNLWCYHSILQVRTRRVQLYPLFEDYDGVHIGSITRNQVNFEGS